MSDLHKRDVHAGGSTGGLAALRGGDRGRARELLGRAVRENPSDEQAWIGLAATFAELDRRRYCLERALTINPANQGTRRALADLASPGDDAGEDLAWVEAALACSGPAPAAAPPPAAAPSLTSPAPGAIPAAGMSLAARIAAAEARRGPSHDVAQPGPPAEPAPPVVEPLRSERVGRVRRVSEPPVQLRPMLLSETPSGVAERPSDEQIAEAAVARLLRGRQDGRTAPAASIAERYFGTARPQEGETAVQAQRALDAGRSPRRAGRPARLIGALVVICLIGVLLFAVLVALNGAAA